MAILLGCDSVHLEFPTKLIAQDVTLGVNEGDRIGIVGKNGDGKSSLLGVLSGAVPPVAGRVTRRRAVTVGVLGQRDALDSASTVPDGKSSLLGVLSGAVPPDAGRVTRRRDVTVGVLGQRDALDSASTVHRVVVGRGGSAGRGARDAPPRCDGRRARAARCARQRLHGA